MKEHQLFAEPPAPPTQQHQQQQQQGANEDSLKQRNDSLQGRVRVLQVHNRRLESCIAQLKLIAEMVSTKHVFILSRMWKWYWFGLADVPIAQLKLIAEMVSQPKVLWLCLIE